jgi:hypothetical protein
VFRKIRRSLRRKVYAVLREVFYCDEISLWFYRSALGLYEAQLEEGQKYIDTSEPLTLRIFEKFVDFMYARAHFFCKVELYEVLPHLQEIAWEEYTSGKFYTQCVSCDSSDLRIRRPTPAQIKTVEMVIMTRLEGTVFCECQKCGNGSFLFKHRAAPKPREEAACTKLEP